MKATIRDDQNRQIIEEEYVNENSLLEVSKENDDFIVTVRYVESPSIGIREHHLTKINFSEYKTLFSELVRISDDNTTIAIFKCVEDGFVLEKVYDASLHEFLPEEYMDIKFMEKFSDISLNNQLILKKDFKKTKQS